ncbi:MAG: hypothetical protein HPY69_16055 [Armatimonadetes bacterium]|nr:hypothetical protein [Armatimonadota bacterium]
MARGQLTVAGEAYLRGLHCLAEAEPGAETPFLADAPCHLEQALKAARHEADHSPYLDLAWASLVAGAEEVVERCLDGFVNWCSYDGRGHIQWRQASDWLALSRGASVQFSALSPEEASRSQPLSYAEHLRRRRLAQMSGER